LAGPAQVFFDDILDYELHWVAEDTEVATAQGLPVRADAPPMPLGLRLGEVQVGEDREDRRVQGLAVPGAAVEVVDQPLLTGGARFEELEERLAEPDSIDGQLQRFTFLQRTWRAPACRKRKEI
jgi:hypothetical protein